MSLELTGVSSAEPAFRGLIPDCGDGRAGDEIYAHVRGDFCYKMCVHLKVEGPKKPSRGTIGNDADYSRATCAGASATKA